LLTIIVLSGDAGLALRCALRVADELEQPPDALEERADIFDLVAQGQALLCRLLPGAADEVQQAIRADLWAQVIRIVLRKDLRQVA